jgi:quercetin dioxygenase-like cupin family protein
MRVDGSWTRHAALALCVVAAGCRSAAQSTGRSGQGSHDAPGAQVRAVISHALPRMDGERLRVKVVEVTYPPGGASRPHSHPCAVVGYVTEGALRTRVQGQPEAVYHAGESFYEAPNGVHAVSANASSVRPAKFLAYFVCDRETELSVPVADTTSTSSGGR